VPKRAAERSIGDPAKWCSLSMDRVGKEDGVSPRLYFFFGIHVIETRNHQDFSLILFIPLPSH
jgi:hypothetical protein